MANPDDVDQLARDIGGDVFDRLGRTSSDGWLESIETRLLEWTMDQPEVKTPLFRFVDVLPTLDHSGEVVDHLLSYFPDSEQRDDFPRSIRWALSSAEFPLMPDVGTATAVRWSVKRLARRFIAGRNRNEVIESLQLLLDDGFTFSVDRLGEEVLSEREAEDYQQEYLDLLDRLEELSSSNQSVPAKSVSLKLTALDPNFEPMAPGSTIDEILPRLLPILHKARERNVIVYFDMEQDETRELTYRLVKRLLSMDEFKDWEGLGVVVQAYLKESYDDVEDLYQWAMEHDQSLWVRLVKGAYWDAERVKAIQNNWRVPVYEHKGRTDANFERIVRLLTEASPYLKPAFGSHNIRSLSYGIASARLDEVPDDSWECQMLYGMGKPIQNAIRGMGVNTRVYTPFGELIPGMAYLVRRLLENTSNEGFLRQTFHEDVNVDQLLSAPDPDEGKAPATDPNGYQTVGPTHFGREDNIERQRNGFDAIENELGDTHSILVEDKWVQPNQSLESVNPSRTSETVGRIAVADEELVERAIAHADGTFSDWRETPTEERSARLKTLAGNLEANRQRLTALIVKENGKNWREADADVMEAIDFCHYYAEQVRQLESGHQWDWPGEVNHYRYEARGPAAVIAPWNFPLAILAGMTTAALVTGNPVLLKPSSQTPIIAKRFVELAEDAGFDDGVLQLLPGSGQVVGDMLVRDPRTAIVAFTGSKEIGLKINRQASRIYHRQDRIKETVLEMGGKNAVIVDNDANLDRAVDGIVRSAFGYQGQKCSACSRVIALNSVADELVGRIAEATDSLPMGPADDPKNFLGPVIDNAARNDIVEYQESARREGEVVLEPSVPEGLPEGHYLGPMVVDHVDPQATIAQEEIFGPILSVIRVDGIPEAIRVANDVDYALTGGLYSRHPDVIDQVKRDFKVGNLYINQPITGAMVGRQPFGGFKLSGKGTKAGGPDYLRHFVWPRTITENTVRRGFAPDEHV